MSKIGVNIVKLRETASVYRNSRTELETILNDLKSSVENLKSGWSGEARNSFSEQHFPKVCESMKKHIERISVLEKELTTAANDFEQLDSELNSRF